MSILRKQERTEGKAVRVPFSGPRLRLQLSDADRKTFEEQGYVPRWFNDQDGRIERAQGGGYTFVKPDEVPSLGSGAIHEGNTDLGPVVSKIVSKGDPVIRGYLMKIQKEYYDADQAAKEEGNAKVDEALAAGGAGGASVENQYGSGVTYSHS